MSAIQLFDLNGEQRFTGTSVGGGGSQPQPFNYYGSNTGGGSVVSVASGGGGALAPWVAAPFYPGQGSQPFNLTDPTNPVVLVSGNYSFTVEGSIYSAHTGQLLSITLYLDTTGIDDGPGDVVPLESGLLNRAIASCTRYLAAGMTIQLALYQDSGGALDVDTWMQISREVAS